MHICFIEDTHLHGGTQIWVTEANRAFLASGADVTVLAPEDSWVIQQCAQTDARLMTYDWDGVVRAEEEHVRIWTEALRPCDVAICTVHPPREGFHCSVFAAHCIKLGDLKTHLIPKTGTIVPSYLREFYLPDESIRSSVIAIADFTRRYLVETYKIPEDLVSLIYQGTDIHTLTPSRKGKAEAIKRYPLPESATPVLAYAGSFEHRKGLPVLLDAVFELASGPLSDVHLMLVGDGPDEAMLRDHTRDMGIEANVTFFPFTREPKYIFERADITVLSSTYKEGLPNILLESMAMHTPVVSTNLGGVPEIVIDGETGYKVETENSEHLAMAIQNLWSDQKAYRRMRKNARRLVEEKFDKERQFKRFLEYFEACISVP
ncbi:MAG: glycosyltransferase [Anaerolineales bacterium]|nr:glycosyltransferase [Anaerolineales bacterium]